MAPNLNPVKDIAGSSAIVCQQPVSDRRMTNHPFVTGYTSESMDDMHMVQDSPMIVGRLFMYCILTTHERMTTCPSPSRLSRNCSQTKLVSPLSELTQVLIGDLSFHPRPVCPSVERYHQCSCSTFRLH